MTDLLLLGILIMLIISFHYNTSSSGRYMKFYDILVHRLPKYLRKKTACECKIAFYVGKANYRKVKDKGVKLWQTQQWIN